MDSSGATTPIVRVFGGVGVYGVDGPISIGGPRQRRLLALLTIRLGSVVSIDWLAENLWDDEDRPKETAPALRTYVSRLRTAFPEVAQEWIETEAAGYRFGAPAEAVEHRRFGWLRTEARRARDLEDPHTSNVLLDEALALFRGDPFRELEDLDWARADIERLHLDRLEMHEERWESALALGRHTQIIGELAAFTTEHGLRERAARQYALALHRSGRTTEALRVIDDYRRRLADQSGLEPSPEIIDLEQALLTGDPSLIVEKVGRPLRGYRLLEEIGTGAFSVVWRGVQPSVDREVAIKQIRSELASQPDFIRRFEAEAHLVARIEHPHIVPLIDFWRDPDSAYLVMRWLRGGTLERRLDDGPLSVSETVQMARQIGEALSAAHQQNVVHRDVKAGNILFDEAGNAFLTDFGIALEVAESGGPEAALSPGSPAYSSPEQIRRERLGPEADVFSLGVVIFECLTGSLPFGDSTSLEQLVDRQLHAPYPLLSDLRPEVPASVSEAVAKATAKNSEDRFASVQEFINALASDVETSAAVVPVADDTPNPYKGLRAFEDGDADQFFGRESLVNELVSRLAGNTIHSRGLVVVGPSGSGKSSVVRAGLTPALRGGAVPGSSDWFVTMMVPGTDPYESLEAALLRIAVNPPASLLGQLRDGKRGILRAIRRCMGSDEGRVLVVIDQFEEIFTGASAEDADNFLAALSVAIEDPTSPLRLVITLRADYYHRPLEHPEFARIVKETAVDVTPLAGDELERAIVEPARELGVGFEAGLVARIAAETVGQTSPLPLLQYTLSELFDLRDGNTLTVAAYDEIGGLSGALAARAEALHAEANGSEQTAIRRIFGRMTNPGEESADLRRRVPVSDLGDDPANDWVLDGFGKARLITFDRDVATREPTVEVAHEALLREWPRLVTWLAEDAEVLRSADAIAGAAGVWDDGGREPTDLYRGGRLESAVDLAITTPDRLRPIDNNFIEASRASADAERGKEQRRVRRLRRLVSGVAAALVIALIAGAVAVREQSRANDQAERANDLADQEAAARQEAETQAARAESQTAVAETQAARAEEQTLIAEAAAEAADLATIISRSAALSSENPEVSILLALEAHRRAPGPETEQTVLNALGSSSIPNRIVSLPPLNDATDACGVHSIAEHGMTQFGILADVLVTRDTTTGTITEHGPSPIECGRWIGDERADRRFAGDVSDEGSLFRSGTYDGPWEVEAAFTDEMFLVSRSITDSNRLVFVSFPDGVPSVILLNATTLDQVGATRVDGDAFLSDASSGDGSLIALGWAITAGPEGDGHTLVVDAETGEEVFHVTSDFPAIALAFDDAAGHLIAALFDGTLITIDLQSEAIISEVESAWIGQPLDLGVRDDGLILAVTSGEIELIDRFAGTTGDTVELFNTDNAFIRSDETVLLLSPENSVDVVDLGGNALIERSWPVDGFAQIGFGAGFAADISLAGDVRAGLTDLATGARTDLEFVLPDGTAYIPYVVWPQSDSVWALGEDRRGAERSDTITRWEDGTLIETLPDDLEAASGAFDGEWLAMVGTGDDGSPQAQLVNIKAGTIGVQVTLPASEYLTANHTGEGGLHVLDSETTVRTYDSTGTLVREITAFPDKPQGIWVGVMATDPASGDIAIATADGIRIVDAATGTVEVLRDFRNVANLAFVRDGQLLIVVELDGTVRLWDLEGGTAAGLVWDGTGGARSEPPWYDEATETVWIATSGLLIRVPLDPERWIERACEVVGRDLTQDEWDRYVPGGGEVLSACAQSRAETDSDTAPTAVEPVGEIITIEGEIDFDTSLGSFTVTAGSDALGCEAGTQDETNGAAGVEKTLTCESGVRSGTFTITFVPPEGTWEVTGATGDFEGLSGGGEWSGQADGSTGNDTWSGEITFSDD